MSIRFCKYSIPYTTGILLLSILLFCSGCARKDFYAGTPVTDPNTYQLLQQPPETVQGVPLKAGSHYSRGLLYRALWGTRHRNAWAAPVVVPILQVDAMKGGLKVEKIGGGMQTINVSLVGGNGMTYSLRTVDKRPEVNLPFPLSSLFIADLIKDQTSALHPYAALVVAPLSEAAGIPHPTPELVYVRPGEQALGEHQTLLSDKFYMLEEKFNDKRALIGQLKHASDIVGTRKMLSRRDEHYNHSIDQLAFAKARLFDLLIGDRDRHEDQWEWAVYKKDQQYVYHPIPKDRDNAFFRFDDGLFSWLLSRKWAQRKFVTFHGDYRDVKALMIKSAYIDSRALPQVTMQQFDSLARQLQHSITDEVIDKAVRQLPESVYALDGETLASQLKNRRNTLDKAAREFYEALAEKVQVKGTNKSDIFEIIFQNDEETDVIVRARTDDKVLFSRRFYSSQTKNIVLEGLDGDDDIILSGRVGKKIKISFDGGKGMDSVTYETPAPKWKRSVSFKNTESKD